MDQVTDPDVSRLTRQRRAWRQPMQLIALKFLAALAGNGNLTAVALLADLYFDQRRVRTAGRSRI